MSAFLLLMTKLYIPSTIKTDFLLLHSQLTAVICLLFNNVTYADGGNVSCQCVAKYIAQVHSKMDLHRRIARVTPMMMPRPCPSSSR